MKWVLLCYCALCNLLCLNASINDAEWTRGRLPKVVPFV